MDAQLAQRPVNPDLLVRSRQDDRGVVLSVAGDVDLVTAEQFQAAFDHAMQLSPEILVVDLSEVRFFASICLRLLAEAHDRAGHGVVRLVAGASIARAIKIAGLHRTLPNYPTIEHALSART